MWYYKLITRVCVVSVHILGHSNLDNSFDAFCRTPYNRSYKTTTQKKKVLGPTSRSSVPFLCFMVYILYDDYTVRLILPVGRKL